MTSQPAAWDAGDYARNSSAQAQWARELMNKLGLSGEEQILDIGSGDGSVTAELARRVPRGAVLGIDSSAEMVALAQSRLEAEPLPNLSFRQMDAARLDLPRAFDVAFSNATLHWVSDHVAVLRGVRACLRRGGRILFQMGGRGNAREVAAVVDRLTRSDRWGRWFGGFVSPYHFYGREEYERWLPGCGYRARRIELIPRDMRHEGPEGLRGWLRTTWFPYAACLPEAEREEFWGEVMSSYLSDFPPDAAGRTHVAMVRLEVEAEAAGEG